MSRYLVLLMLTAAALGQTASKQLTITIAPAPVVITTSTLPSGTVGITYPSTTLAATGGVLPYTWSVTSGTMPPGLTLSAAGVISGTPTSAVTATVTFTVKDATAVAQHSVDVTWTASVSPGVIDYGVYRNNTKIATVAGTAFTDMTVISGQTYSYKATARDAIRESGFSNTSTVTVP